MSRSRRPVHAFKPVTAQSLSITTADAGPFVHFPASEADLRALMARLPEGALDRLGSIELCVTPPPSTSDATLDPFIGRLTNTVLPGIHVPPTLGSYTTPGNRIRLYGYVYGDDLRERTIIELYLRLRMLSTFMHELGHHDDFTATVRGRWRGTKADRERYANAFQLEWTRTHVVPFLEDAYRDEVAELRRWLEHHAGVAIPLDVLLGNDSGGSSSLFNADTAFASLFEGIADGKPAVDLKLDVAFELHYGYHFELALSVIDHVLAEAPDHVDALGWRAHVLYHLGRNPEADAIARTVLALDPTNRNSWHQLLVSAERAADWPGAVDASSRLLATDLGNRVNTRRSALAHRARAYLELGQLADAQRDLDELRAIGVKDKRLTELLRRYVELQAAT